MNMMSKSMTLLLFIFILLPAACMGGGPVDVTGQPQAKDVFSFIAAGDSRTEVYLTGGREQDEAMREVIVTSYGLAGAPNVDEIKKSFQITFDCTTGELESVMSPGRYIDYFRDGWPIIRRVCDGGKIRGVIMRDTGRQWVNRGIAAAINNGAQFLVHGGDFIQDGTLGQTVADSPYWQLFYEELAGRIAHLPPLKIGRHRVGRIFGVIGNHEVYRDPKAKGFFSLMPWLRKLGMTDDKWIYSFSYRNCYFIFLYSGPTLKPEWDSKKLDFNTQMDYLTEKLKDARKKQSDHVFVVYHKPSFVKAGHGPLPMDQNPHKVLKQYVDKLKLYVFNSHSHTTEQYRVDKVNYFVLGAAGASQNFTIGKHPSPEPELYWKGEPRVEDYNYMEVKINGKNIECWIHRFRPTKTEKPIEVIKVLPR
jgi:hypothetical protein